MTFAWWHLLIAAIPRIPVFWSIWHIWAHAFGGDFQKKVKWLVLVVFIPVLGALFYIAVGRKDAGARIL